MRSFWESNKNAIVKDLVRHATALTNIQYSSKTMKGPCNSVKHGNSREIRKSQTAASMVLYMIGTFAFQIYNTQNTQNKALVMIMPPARSLEGLTLRSWFIDFATISSSADSLANFLVCLFCSYHPFTCPLNIEATGHLNVATGESAQRPFCQRVHSARETIPQTVVVEPHQFHSTRKSDANGAMVKLQTRQGRLLLQKWYRLNREFCVYPTKCVGAKVRWEVAFAPPSSPPNEWGPKRLCDEISSPSSNKPIVTIAQAGAFGTYKNEHAMMYHPSTSWSKGKLEKMSQPKRARYLARK